MVIFGYFFPCSVHSKVNDFWKILKSLNLSIIFKSLLVMCDAIKTVLKGGYVGWKGGSSFASLWFERWLVWAYKCAYDCGVAYFHSDIFTPFLFNQFSCSLKSGIFLSSSFQKSVEWFGYFK